MAGPGNIGLGRGRTGVVPLLLGSGALSATVCPSASGTRNAAGPVAAGQSGGARGVAAGASVDRSRTVLREKPTRLERRVLQLPCVHLGDGIAGGRGRVIAGASAVGETAPSSAAGKLDALSTAAGTGGGDPKPVFIRTNYKSAEFSMKSTLLTLTFATPSNIASLTNFDSGCWELSSKIVLPAATGTNPR
jgi:hypothetical protein